MIRILGFVIIRTSELDKIKKSISDVEIDMLSLKHVIETLKKQLRDIYQ